MKKKVLSITVMLFVTIYSFAFEVSNIIVNGNSVILSEVISLSSGVSVGEKIPPEEIEKREEKIKEEVLSLGYFGNANIRLIPVTRENVELRIQVLEFPVIKKINVNSDSNIKREEIISRMKTKENEILNINNFKEDLSVLRDYLMKKGIIIGGRSSFRLNDTFDEVIIDIYRAKIAEIMVSGNKKTRLNVITRELEFDKGDYYDFVTLRRSYQNLANTGYFNKVDFVPENNDSGDVNMKVTVEEGETGAFRFGGTYGDENGLSGLLELSDKNFRGTGIDLKMKAEFGGMDNYELGYFNPRWRDKKISQGFNLYRTKYDRDKYDDTTGNYLYSYDELRKGANLSWGMSLTRFTKFSLAFYDEDIEITPEKPELQNDHLQTFKIGVSKSITDNVFYPEFGYSASSSVELTGSPFKGKDDFSRYTTDFRYYKKMSSKMVFASRIKYGKTDIRKGVVEDYEKFSLGGGTSIRGYKSREFLGEELLLGNIEFRYSFGESFKIFAFVDKGNMDFDSTKGIGEKTGTGFGVLFKTPFGMIRLDWGTPDESGRKSKNYFNFGTMF
jgi:outer membrane protein insertion porin family